MGDATHDLVEAAHLPEGDVVRTLLEQHARIRILFDEVRNAIGSERSDRFAELRALLAVHETAEQLVVRPMSEKLLPDIAADRTREEAVATDLLAALDKLDPLTPEFAAQFTEFEKAVTDHAEAEEKDEFPALLAGCTPEQRQRMGTQLKVTEQLAPTRPHPAVAGHRIATALTGPLASIVDRTRDAIRKAS